MKRQKAFYGQAVEKARLNYEASLQIYNQYVTKIKEIKRNIIQPDYNKFNYLITKSLEEFGLLNEFSSLVDVYYLLKKSKRTYRLSVTEFSGQFSRLFSTKSLVKQLSQQNI